MEAHTKPGPTTLYIQPLTVIAAVAWFCCQSAFASADDRIDADQIDGDPTTYLGGRNSIPAQLDALADVEKAPFLERLKSAYGISITADYAAMFQSANNVLSGEKHGMSGVFRLYGSWTFAGRGTPDTGSIITKLEHRHAYGDTAPAELASNVGYVGVNAIGFTDVGGFVAPLYWQQYMAGGSLGLVAGRLDPLDFVDILGIGSQWTSFQNAATIANLALPIPDLGCGFGAGKKFNDQWVVGFTAHDLNGSQTSMDCFPDGLELYKQAYVSWAPSRSLRFSNAVHLTIWHADSRDAGQSSGKGVALSANWLFDDKWMPFVRIGVSDGEAAIMESQLSGGLTYRVGQNRSEVGAAVSFQQPAIDTLDRQTTYDLYFRWQVTPKLAVTPSLQFLHNPALSPERKTVVLGGLRIRYTR